MSLKNKIQTIFCLLAFFVLINANAETFKFVALGDMPYNIPNDYIRFERLIQQINKSQPSFSIFIGDTKSGGTPCSNEHVEKIQRYFNEFESPLIYSPGDNEWTDCHRLLAGSFNPLERLQNLRESFFQSKNSLGKTKLPLIRQPDVMKQFSQYVENSYWIKNKILFVSLNIPGSNNNFERNLNAVEEYYQRNAANLAWIEYTFNVAKKQNLSAIVFAYQADMFYSPNQATDLSSGYRDTLNSFTINAERFNNPVLLIHGDSHFLKIDQPLKTSNKKNVLENVVRLQVMGEEQIQAVEITIDPNKNSPFSFRPLIVPANSR